MPEGSEAKAKDGEPAAEQPSEAESLPAEQARSTESAIFYAIVAIVTGVLLLAFSRLFDDEPMLRQILALSGLAAMMFGASGSSLAYLTGARRRRQGGADADRAGPSVQEELRDIRRRITESEVAVLDILQDFVEPRLREVPQPPVRKLRPLVLPIRATRKASRARVADDEYRRRAIEARARLLAEVDALTRRGNLNLVIGGFATLCAVGLLGYVALTANTVTGDVSSLLWHFLPRLSIALFMEVFAFFFLNLYRRALDDIKYYQNELTNMDAKLVAMELATSKGGNDTTLGKVVDEFLKTERNFKLGKDESTVELEKAKLDVQTYKDVLLQVSRLIRPEKSTAPKKDA
jgi:hypothetical protein